MNSLYWLYVYYKTPADKAAEWAEASQAIVNHINNELGVQAKLLRRPQAIDGAVTWMEVYGPLPERMLDELNNALSHARTTPEASVTESCINWQSIQLHTELFLENGAINAYA
jgi:hypothetical protein